MLITLATCIQLLKMVFEKPRKPCINKNWFTGKEQLCNSSDSKTIYIREIKDREPLDKEVKTSYGTTESRTFTKHKMRWVKVGTFCLLCHNINYDPAWLESNKKEHYDFYVRCMAFEGVNVLEEEEQKQQPLLKKKSTKKNGKQL